MRATVEMTGGLVITAEDHDGMLELRLPESYVSDCSGPGRADPGVRFWREVSEDADSFRDVSDDTLREVLRGYGAWDDPELADRVENIERVIWIAACDAREGQGWQEEEGGAYTVILDRS